MHPAPFAPQMVRCLEFYHLKRSAPALDDKDGSPKAKTLSSVKRSNSKPEDDPTNPHLEEPSNLGRPAPNTDRLPDRLDRRTDGPLTTLLPFRGNGRLSVNKSSILGAAGTSRDRAAPC